MGKRKEVDGLLPRSKRSSNFSQGEIEIIKSEVEKRKTILFGKFSATLTTEVKTNEWKKVLTAVNAVSTCNRSLEEVKKKWENIKSTVKTSLHDKLTKPFMRKTGGGSPREPLDESDERMLGILGTTQILGVAGGLDTSALSEIDNEELDNERNEEVTAGPSHPLITATSSSPVPTKKQEKSATGKLLKVQMDILGTLRQLVEIQTQRLGVEKERLDILKQQNI